MADLRLNGILTPPVSTGRPAAGTTRTAENGSFSDILQSELEDGGLKFSRHAQSRLESRNITLQSDDLTRLSGAVEKAAGKGVQDSLVLMGNLAFIVSVPDKTVVTALPVDEAQEHVFTNIDGAVIA